MKRSDKLALISQIPLFANLPAPELVHLAETLHPGEYKPGTLLICEGEADDRVYILIEGEAEVIKALGSLDERQLAIRSPGAVFGEMSLFVPGYTRTASVRAYTTIHTLEMTREMFDGLLHRYPNLAYNMVRQMSRRLEESENSTILDLREKNQQLTQAYHELQAAQEQLLIKEKLERELAIARQIQESILPAHLPQLEGFDIAAMTIPARAVGGDYYDFILLDKHHLGLVVGDACDKGVPAALLISLTSSLVHIEASRNPSPEATLKLVNHHLMEMSHSGMFVTLLYGTLEPSGRFDYCRAGHPHPIVLDDKLQLVDTVSNPGMPLGIHDDIVLDTQSVIIPAGGLMLIYSDGLSEALNSMGEQFGIERLHDVLCTISHLPAAQICASLRERVQEFVEEQPQSDDFTVLIIKRSQAK